MMDTWQKGDWKLYEGVVDGTLMNHPLNMTHIMTQATQPGSVQAPRDPHLLFLVGT